MVTKKRATKKTVKTTTKKTAAKRKTKSTRKPKFLIIYYSFTGNTMKIAHDIAHHMGGELEQIFELNERKGFFKYVKCVIDSRKSVCTQIDFPNINYSKYDMILVGGPVWAGKMAPAIRSFMKKIPVSLGNKAVLFTTCGGENSKVLDEMEKLILKRGYKVIMKDEFASKLSPSQTRTKITKFCAKLLGPYK